MAPRAWVSGIPRGQVFKGAERRYGDPVVISLRLQHLPRALVCPHRDFAGHITILAAVVALNEGLRRKKALWRPRGRGELESLVLAPWARRRRQSWDHGQFEKLSSYAGEPIVCSKSSTE
jgi:hypothetical protein